MLRALILCTLICSPLVAYAQGTGDGRLPAAPPDPTRAEGERACGKDAREVCRNALSQGDMAVLSCFQQNRSAISQDCDAFLRKMGQ
jgi:hypothetical protein